MSGQIIPYPSEQVTCKGYLALPKGSTGKKYPGIVIAHAWRGQDNFARKKADELAELGYVGFAADLYGDGKTVVTDEEALALMLPLFLDRNLLRKRINAALDTLKNIPSVDASRLGAIGFCFGGLTVIELLRSGADLRGVVSFHGLLGYTLFSHKATPVASAQEIKGALLILHGASDPSVSQEDIVSIQQEFTKAKVDWQMHSYGNVVHAFTNPEAHDEKKGLLYNQQASERAHISMRQFFKEIFK